MSIQNTILPDNPEIEVVKAGKTGLFTNYIFKAIPLVFDESMSYYETLCGLLNYLKNTIIPTVNNNADAVAELQTLYEQLRTYVDDYFTNLDVQEEINNKLDNMVATGELQQLLNLQYQDLLTEVNSIISIQNNKINSLNNFPPIVVTNINEMTDHTKVYLLTSDNNWYYYNGTNWVIGGSYNSQPIANGSIDILKLDEFLQNTFEMNYDECFELNNAYQGYVNDVNGVVEITTTSPGTISYKYYIIPLELGEIYTYTGKSHSIAKGLIIADSNENVILKSRGSDINNITFKVNDNNLKAYVGVYVRDSFESSTPYEFTLFKESSVLRKLNNITNKIGQNITPSLVQIMNNIACLNYDTENILKLQSIEDYDTYMYSCKKGDKFRITYSDRYLVKGFYATDKNYMPKKLGDASQYPTTTTINWTSTFDGFIFLTKFSQFTPSILKIVDNVEIHTDGIYSVLKGKTIAYDGDSITQSRINQGNQSNGGAYPKLIADLTESYYINNAKGGATLSYKNGSTNCICRRLEEMPSNADAYVFSGGINDMWDRRPLGTLTSNYTDEVDDTTVIGALEKIFRYALSNFVGKPILFVITQKVRAPYTIYNNYNQFDLHDALVSVCKKYSIPYYDAFNDSGLNGWNTEQSNRYLNANSQGTTDGTHPNEDGYLIYYVPQVLNLLNANILQN